MVQASDGGFVIAGSTSSKGAGRDDVWLIKTNANGDSLWSKTFGGSETDEALSVVQTSDGGFVMAGSTASKGAGFNDVWLVKTNASGTLVWDKTFGGSNIDQANSVIEASDKGFVLAGQTLGKGAGGSDCWVIKADSTGNQVWEKTFGGSDLDVAHSVVEVSGGGFIIGGETKSKGFGNRDFWLIKVDASGNKVWDSTFGGGDVDIAYSVLQASDGNFVLAGYTKSKGAGGEDAWLVKYRRK